MSCPICSDTRWKSTEIDGVERVVRCDCWRDALVDRVIDAARIPARFAKAELESYRAVTDSPRAALAKATRFVEAFPVVDGGLLFHGPVGVGKTHLAVGVLKAVIRKTGARGYFFETPDLLRQVRNTYNTRVDETEMGVLHPVLHAELLVLDDLGAEKTSEWVQETLGLVINARYNARRPTIITTNLQDDNDSTNPNSFMFQVGARTRSRLVEMCEWIQIEGADERDKDREAAAARSGQWPEAPDNIKKTGLPSRARGQARAQMRDKGMADLKWTGGKAGS